MQRFPTVLATLFCTALALGPTSLLAAGVVAVRIPSSQLEELPESALAATVRSYDYPSFRWLVGDPSLAGALAASGVDFELVTGPFTLVLGELAFDPLDGVPELPPGLSPAATGGPDLRLVQAWGPGRPEWLTELETAGLEVVQYLHPMTWVVWGGRGEAAAARALPWVRWVGDFAPAFRLLPRARGLAPQPRAVELLLYRGADQYALLRGLEGCGAELGEPRPISEHFAVVGARAAGDRLVDAARVPGVYSVQLRAADGGSRGELADQLVAGNVDAAGTAHPGYPAWLAAIGLSGHGVIVANVDEGVDDQHPDLVDRMLPCAGGSCGGGTTSFHGTHTAGITAGDGGSAVADGGGFLRGLGVSPGAGLVEQLYSPTYLEPDGMRQLVRESRANGAVLSGNAWGPSGTALGYDNDTMQVDLAVRDAEPGKPGNQAFTYVLSLMNGYGGTSSQGTPDEAKNVITVGSTRLQEFDGSQTGAVDDLSDNSGHGPALDGRTIPHLVAPGCRVDSTLPGSSYGLFCGTSMSSAVVAGAAALCVERLRRLVPGVDPSPAMVKAALLLGALDLAGAHDADGNLMGHPFASTQGWGRLDLGATLAPQAETHYLDNPWQFETSGEQWVRSMTVADPGLPRRLMLVWTDAAGHGLGGSTPAWNNDLDLIVEAGGTVYRGNDFGADGWSRAGGTADAMNNTEAVFLPPSANAELTVRVRATQLPSDGIPGNGAPTDQDFSLAVSNLIPGPCEAAPFFRSLPTVSELVIEGAQVIALDWMAVATCGGSLSARILVSDGGIVHEVEAVATTTASSITLLGAAPGRQYCFQVELREDGLVGQRSPAACVSGSAARAAGDVDCDGDVDAADLDRLALALFDGSSPECAGYPAADTDLDGREDAADLARLVTFVADPL